MNYLAYMSSQAWRNSPVRLREFAAAGFQCRLCPNSHAKGHVLEAHHRTYERLGSEVDGDLTTLCHECHRFVTSMLRARRYAALSLPHPRDSRAPENRELFDESTKGALK